jgi:hypothetical protein
MLVIRKKKGIAGIALLLDEIGELKIKDVLAIPFYEWKFGLFNLLGIALIGAVAAVK